LWPFGPFSSHFVYFMALLCMLWSFGIFSTFWYIVPRKIWQPSSSLLENVVLFSEINKSVLLCTWKVR
jgi:hypothetical protein